MKRFNLLVLVLVLALASACAPKKSRDRGSIRGRGPGITLPGGSGTVIPPGGTGGTGGTFQPVVGIVENSNVQQFEQVLLEMLGTITSTSNISLPVQGVRIGGDIRVNGSNDISSAASFSAQSPAAGSYFAFRVYDSAATTQDEYYYFNYMVGQGSTTINMTKNGNMVTLEFRDSSVNDVIILQGSFNASYYSGQAIYQAPGNAQQKNIGTFRVATCGFFHCGN